MRTTQSFAASGPCEAEDAAQLDEAAAGAASLELSADLGAASDVLESLKILEDASELFPLAC